MKFFIMTLLILGGLSAKASDRMIRFRSKLETAVSNLKKLSSARLLSAPQIDSLQLAQEIEQISLQIEDSTLAFTHHGQKTWVQTGTSRFSKIVMRPLAMIEKTDDLNVQDLMSILLHEIGHHLVGESETQAWALASSVMSLLDGILPVPELMKVSNGTFQSSSVGCRDTVDVSNLDILTARFDLKVTTSDGHCRIFRPRLTAYEFDSVNYSLQCTRYTDGSFCEAINRSTDYIRCKSSASDIFKSKNFFNAFRLEDGQSLRGLMSYCLFESSKAAVLNTVSHIYHFSGQAVSARKLSPLSQQEFSRFETEDMWVGLDIFVRQHISAKSIQELFVDE